MSSRKLDQQTEIAALKHELALNSFLNKGILQTNSEYQVTIGELQRENEALRIAESRLSETEDALEAAEASFAKLQQAKDELEQRVQTEIGRREAAQRDVSVWKGKYEEIKEVWESVIGVMHGALRPPVPKREVEAGPSRASSARNSVPSHRHSKAPSPQPSPMRQVSAGKKRRRVHETDPDEEEEDEELVIAPRVPTPMTAARPRTPPPKARTRIEPRRAEPKSASKPSGRKRIAQSHRIVSDEIQVKTELVSPGHGGKGYRKGEYDDEESEDDPLAME